MVNAGPQGAKIPGEGSQLTLAFPLRVEAGVRPLLDRRVPRSRLRESVIGTLAVEVGHVEDAVAATKHKLGRLE